MDPKYTPNELYKLYWAFKDGHWSKMSKFFFGSREPKDVKLALGCIAELYDRTNYNISDPISLDYKASYVTFINIKKMMYTVPFDQLPLYINARCLSIVAKWRLDLGK